MFLKLFQSISLVQDIKASALLYSKTSMKLSLASIIINAHRNAHINRVFYSKAFAM